jgi:hypothetical protein
MHGDEEPLRIPITDVFDLHAVEPREVAAVVEAYLDEAARLRYCANHPRSRHRRAAEDRACSVGAHAVRLVLSGCAARGGRLGSNLGNCCIRSELLDRCWEQALC